MLLGSRGSLGSTILELMDPSEVFPVDRVDCEKWARPEQSNLIQSFISSLPSPPRLIINAVGKVDVSVGLDTLLLTNFHLPKNLINATRGSEINIVTFGSALEIFPGLSKSNNYLASKSRFRDYLERNTDALSRTLHLQANTFYGGQKFHQHMFLSQMFHSIQRETQFFMSSGRQLREYHHVVDDVLAMQFLLKNRINGIVELNHGQPLTLYEIATKVFSYYGLTKLLKVGELISHPDEDLLVASHKPHLLDSIRFRDTIPGIIEYFDLSLKG